MKNKYGSKVVKPPFQNYSPEGDHRDVLNPAVAEEIIQEYAGTVVEAVKKNLEIGSLTTTYTCPYHPTDLLEARQPADFLCRDRIAFLALRRLKEEGFEATSGWQNIHLNKSQFSYELSFSNSLARAHGRRMS